MNDSTDTYVEQNSNEKVKEIHERIKVLKKNRAVEDRYMHYLYVDKIIEEQENALKRMEEELESKKKALEKTEDDLKKVENKRIRNENNINILKSIHKIALKAESIKQFEEQIANL